MDKFTKKVKIIIIAILSILILILLLFVYSMPYKVEIHNEAYSQNNEDVITVSMFIQIHKLLFKKYSITGEIYIDGDKYIDVSSRLSAFDDSGNLFVNEKYIGEPINFFKDAFIIEKKDSGYSIQFIGETEYSNDMFFISKKGILK